MGAISSTMGQHIQRYGIALATLALGACHSIHDPNIVAAETLPDTQYHDPAPPATTRCDPTTLGCRPPEDPKRCWDPDVRAAYPHMCNTVDASKPKWRGGVKEEP